MSILEKKIRSNIALHIKTIRESKKMTQFDLAKATGLSQGAISQYEAGFISLEIMTVLRLCDGLGCTIDYLLGRDSEFGSDTLRGRLFGAFSAMNISEQEMFVGMLEYLVKDRK